MRIIFMGTPRFASTILEALYKHGHTITAVYTKPGSNAYLSARQHNTPIKTPPSLKDYTIKEEADVAVVAAYGLLIPQNILEQFKFGCVNAHPSLLPKWRGAAPVERAIMAGDTETGVSIMRLDTGLDTGDILGASKTKIFDDDTCESLTARLANLGAALMIDVLNNIETIPHIKQEESFATYAHKITSQDEKINWSEPGELIMRKIRALYNNPCTYCLIKGHRIKIISAVYTKGDTGQIPGTILSNTMDIAVPGGVLTPKIVQRSGGGRLSTADFLRGFDIQIGWIAE